MRERFWDSVAEDADGCWIWQRMKNNRGYGKLQPGGRGTPVIMAHRYAYESLRAEIPDGLVIDHLCRKPSCVNPWHMEPVSNGENVRRGQSPSSVNREKRACVRGHPFDAANTYITRLGERSCRACHRERQRLRGRVAS